ncbi:MAG: hypothetical protein N3E41_08775 [Thermofilaceae archaeon]|nr:hypothetical protein [Thermofilaceae archaeon]
MSFQFFPSCIRKRKKNLAFIYAPTLSILSQLHPGRGPQDQNLVANFFQFFPSCCTMEKRVVCDIGSRLSILSQLL